MILLFLAFTLQPEVAYAIKSSNKGLCIFFEFSTQNLMHVYSKKVKYQVEQVDVTKVDVLEKLKLLFIFIPNLIIYET